MENQGQVLTLKEKPLISRMECMAAKVADSEFVKSSTILRNLVKQVKTSKVTTILTNIKLTEIVYKVRFLNLIVKRILIITSDSTLSSEAYLS